MNNLPDTVQWLLDFANLGSNPGELNPPRLGKILKVKRPPIEPPSYLSNINDFSLIPKELPYSDFCSRLYSNCVIDDKGFAWLKTYKEVVFCGKSNFYPSLKEFKGFFYKTGIPPIQTKEVVDFRIRLEDGKTYDAPLFLVEDAGGKSIMIFEGFKGRPLLAHFEISKGKPHIIPKEFFAEGEKAAYNALKNLWITAITALHYALKLTNNNENELFIKEFEERLYKFYTIQSNSSMMSFDVLKRKTIFQHDNTLPLAIYAFILDFWINHKELHTYLRQCKCCGKFWIEQKNNERNRKRMFCNEDCKRIFHQQSRSDNLKAVKIKRNRLKEKKQKEDYSQLIELLLKNDYTQKEAKEESFEWIYKKGKSFKEFKRTRAVPYGLN
jgi:hypothetical protein